ncbi:MAG: HD-GYP domain-containing protein [Chloroflexi bacterium]|nr:HD-GYP domain-containing protein [Chloroflexota bacterium]MDA1147190.1 HD-GYP domain-containing protein [Chloroflexota bacterium]
MRRALPEVLPWIIALTASTAAAIALLTSANLDAQFTLAAPRGHFYIVSPVALISVLVGVFAVFAAHRSASLRVLLLALAFLSMATIFAVHGLATPGFILDARAFGVTGFASRLALLVAAVFLGLSAVPWPARLEAELVARRIAVIAVWVAILGAFTAVALTAPESLPPDLVTSQGFQTAASVIVISLGLAAATRYFQGYRRTARPLFGAVTVGALLLVEAQVSMHYGALWGGTFWLYHVQLLTGFSAIFWGLVTEYSRGDSWLDAISRLGERDLVAQIESGHSESIVGLAAALEARDGYTLGHGRRVGALSVLIGKQLGFSDGRLRALSQGALLHDVGKIGIPDAILHKPGSLTNEEFEVIKEHPARGHQIIGSSFDTKIEQGVIRHHHEKFDGSGYPDGLAGQAIPLEARVTAVADVYDALRSARAYRVAWDRDRAVAQIAQDVGTHFDPRCVQAFLVVVDQWERSFAADHAHYEERRASA